MKKRVHNGIRCAMVTVLFFMLMCAFSDPVRAEASLPEEHPEEGIVQLNLQELEQPASRQGANMVLTVPETVTGFSENEIWVDIWGEGTLSLFVYEADGTLRYRSQTDILPGKNKLIWDGTASYGQPLPKGVYDVVAAFHGTDGSHMEEHAVCQLSKNRQSVLYAVPSSDVLYLDDGEMWTVDCSLAQAGTVVMDIYSCDEPRTWLARVSQSVKKESNARLAWNGRQFSGRFVPCGKYLISVYAEGSDQQPLERTVFVQDSRNSDRYPLSIGVTGSILPQRNMSDSEIWAIMMQPSVVYDGTEAVYAKEKPSMRSANTGKINPGKQALEVVSVGTDGWTKVRAWRQEDGQQFEGYLLTNALKVVLPDRQYGLLVDKQTQKLYVYEYGKRIAEVPVSTGLVKYKQFAWETPAGSYLTGSRVESGGVDGKAYECRIVYDGSRVLEQIGFETVRGTRVYTDKETLGEKATRGCIAIPVSPDADMNAWWLYTHLRPGTRLMILDEEIPSEIVYDECAIHDGQDELKFVMTICGDTEIGANGYQHQSREMDASHFEDIQNLFRQDDLTVISLASVIMEEDATISTTRADALKTGKESLDLLQNAGVDVVSVANRHFSDYGYLGRISTLTALEKTECNVVGAGTVFVCEKGGYRIGVLAERESSFIENSQLAIQDISALQSMGCDVIVALCSWGTEEASWQTVRQEEMAQFLLEAGVDVIVGQSSGVQGITTIEGKPVMWNLGRMLVSEEHPASYGSVAAQIVFRFSSEGYSGLELKLIPLSASSQAEQGINDRHPVLLEGPQADVLFHIIQRYSTVFLREPMWFPSIKETIME